MATDCNAKLLITEREASARYGMSVPWFQSHRHMRTGPVYVKIGRAIRYSVGDLDAYFESYRIVPRATQSPATR